MDGARSERIVGTQQMRAWLSGIMSPCQGLVGVSITPARTNEQIQKHP